ncbi:T9SS type A sorting domain-containing protein [Geofilum rubicundum]|uniref:Secretion system C-terminal sorting domain-containing protein n=1 Tax=Geofilum rubicundum JCM 15548 TaxID=1236989 RepID=A0A0E9LVX9_9BACT|nr:T9SS type A sorting domain-containing protein [Geofilum rubicundum]GAO29453.1 hypothetical protein JCM15548_11640 [Geofilum rubicundum JCM 15548]
MVLPNPVADYARILWRGDMAAGTRAEVYNVLGVRVYQGLLTNGEVSVDASSFGSGLFLVRVVHPSGATNSTRFFKK